MNNEMWLRCLVSVGQFSDEYAVGGETFDGEGFSLFAPIEFIVVNRHAGEQKRLPGWVRVAEIDREGELVLVRLPRQTLGNGATITVSASELEIHPSRQEA